ncbi:hypothetical protein [Candidatus Odyssella acanthamoebae]|uniref:Uncharacterized protein n=1 Tax=Candidatus Odyssella acanthamoebae TaxID=91604 RepID=A0A077AVK5_9PROT|nr:hypothetical protein [Candidatus Paracaedibacter acanthamoebae]AIK96074.1 hypothetical protein ID47_03900 [Candidatus Paracaedibacter acanthamoebae]
MVKTILINLVETLNDERGSQSNLCRSYGQWLIYSMNPKTSFVQLYQKLIEKASLPGFLAINP